jgi:hypothetical protein
LTRIYIPLNAARLRQLGSDHAVVEAPFLAHAVTEALKASAPNAHEDEREYAALTDAAQSSGLMLPPGESRRIVATADVTPEIVRPAAAADAVVESAVSISEAVGPSRIVSFHVDADQADEDDELLWYDVTELPGILTSL